MRIEAVDSLRRQLLKLLASSSQDPGTEIEVTAFVQELCRIAVDVGSAARAWVGVALDDAEKTIQIIASASDSSTTHEIGILSWREDSPRFGLPGKAILSGLTQGPELHASGKRSAVSLPVFEGPRAAAVIYLEGPEQESFLPDQLAVFQELAHTLSILFSTLRICQEQSFARDAILEIETRESEIFESITDHFLTLDFDWRFRYVNEHAANSHGKNREQLIGKVIWEEFPALVDSPLYPSYVRAMTERVPTEFEVFGAYTKSWFEGKAYPSKEGITVYYRNVTAKKQAEREVERKNRFVRMLGSTNRAVLRITEEQGLLDEICKIAVEIGGLRAAWVGIAEHDERRTVRVASSFGFVAGFLEGAAPSWLEGGKGWGPAGSVIVTGKPCVVADASMDPRIPEQSESLGYLSGVALPLQDSHGTFGAFCVVSGELNACDPEEVTILEELANDLAFGLTAIRTRSEHAAAQAALIDANAREAEILDSIQDEMMAVDHDWNVTFVNSHATRGLGKTSEEMVGMNFWDLWPQYVGTIGYEEATRAMRDRVPVVFEILSPVTGRWLEVRIYPTEHGVTLYYADVGERKKSELLIARQNCVLKMLNASSQALLKTTEEQALLDEVCRIAVEVGQFRLAWVGYPEENEARSIRCVSRFGLDDGYIELLNLTWADRGIGGGPAGIAIRTGEPAVENDLYSNPLSPKAALDRAFKALLALPLVSGGETFGVLCVYGGEKDAFNSSEIGNLRGLAGDLAHGIMAIRAQQDLKRAEEERSQIEAQLRNSQKIEAIGTLAGGIAHDFNNILGTILGNVELAFQDTATLPAAWQSLDQIRIAAHRARDLTQQILLFGRRQQTTRVVTSLGPIVEQAHGLLRSTIPARIAIECAVDADAPEVAGDVNQLLQVLVNLGSNAAQSIESGPGKIEITVRSSELSGKIGADQTNLAPGKYAQITVRDTGVGMDEATMARIFEPFFTTKGVGEGTGLGLSVVHGIVRSHNGEIVVRSQPNEGTVFEIYLPQAISGLPETAKEAIAPNAGIGKGRRILIIDDDESIVSLCERLLTRKGFQVTGCTNAPAAVDLIRNHPKAFDAVITDYNMPVISGLEVIRTLRQISPDLPIALTSGFITDELRSLCLEAGVKEVIHKTNVVENCSEAIARLLDSDRDS